MLDLTRPFSGSIGPDFWFSDLLLAIIQNRFTGGILLKLPDGPRVLFFDDGDPIHATGTGFTDNYLGQVCVQEGLLNASLVLNALEWQKNNSDQDKPLLGQILVTRLQVPNDKLQTALLTQCLERFKSCFGLTDVPFDAAPGRNERISKLGVQTDSWPLLLAGLKSHASDTELRQTTNRVLGRSIRLKGSIKQIETLMPLDPLERQGLRYLEKLRKPDQLERSVDRRTARAVIRMLELLDLLELQSASKAIPISRVLRTTPAALPATHRETVSAAPTSSVDSLPAQTGPTVSSSVPSRVQARTSRLKAAEVDTFCAEIEDVHLRLGDQNYFEVLGVDHNCSSAELRKRFTELAKKYHPDAVISVTSVRPDLAQKVREISAQVNEAYAVLANRESRKEYEQQLVKGYARVDNQHQNKVLDAEVKAKMAKVRVKAKDYAKARSLLKIAIQNDPNTPAYRAELGWAMFADPDFDRQTALSEGLELLERALKENAESAQTHYYLGRIYKFQGKSKLAAQRFNTAAKLDPNFTEAVREVRLLTDRARKREASGSKSPLRRLFKL